MGHLLLRSLLVGHSCCLLGERIHPSRDPQINSFDLRQHLLKAVLGFKSAPSPSAMGT